MILTELTITAAKNEQIKEFIIYARKTIAEDTARAKQEVTLNQFMKNKEE